MYNNKSKSSFIITKVKLHILKQVKPSKRNINIFEIFDDLICNFGISPPHILVIYYYMCCIMTTNIVFVLSAIDAIPITFVSLCCTFEIGFLLQVKSYFLYTNLSPVAPHSAWAQNFSQKNTIFALNHPILF